MDKLELPSGALEALLKEHAQLRDEIKERLKVAFSHVAYAGAIAAFAIPAADKVQDWIPILPILLAASGFIVLLWIAFLNMRWVQHCGAYVRYIESRVNLHYGCKVLGWEAYADEVQRPLWFQLPPDPRDLKSEQLTLPVSQKSDKDTQ